MHASLLLTLLACGPRILFDAAIPDDGTFARATPDAATLARFEAAAAYSEAHAGRGMMILQGDVVMFEDEQNNHLAETPTELFSGTKSFSCAIALAAIEDGLLDLDELAVDTLDEWADDTEKSAIRVTDLLHFTSGLKEDFFALTLDGMYEEQRIEDKYAFAVAQPMVTPAGETFEYNGTHLPVFGEIITRKTGEDPLSYLEARVLDPITFRHAGWNHDPSGNPMLAFGAWTTTNEWAKYGVLVRDDGAWQGTQVLPAGQFDTCFVGSESMPAYGLAFWLNEELTAAQAEEVPVGGIVGGQRVFPSAPADLVVAAGANDNRLYISRSLGLVVVRVSDRDILWRDDAFLALLFGD
ncbi:MAG: serine hydrolase [Pseudomonadota bacterium]|nr:serine hydrolase [Pseudomonadota bacterium]